MSKLALILVIFSLLSNCTITRYESYRFIGYGAKNIDVYDKADAYIYIHNSIYEYRKTGFLKDKEIYKEPYHYYFTLTGNFEKIEKLNAFFIQNKKNIIEIPIAIDYLNQQKKLIKSSSNNYRFSYGKKLGLPIIWDETDTLEVQVNFVGIVKGIKKKYKLHGEYEKDAIIENTNLKWAGIMGI